jgi:hypothetical protein
MRSLKGFKYMSIKTAYENNYEEYKNILDNFTENELEMAWKALHDSVFSEVLYQMGRSHLLIFQTDTRLQDLLYMYFEEKNSQ